MLAKNKNKCKQNKTYIRHGNRNQKKHYSVDEVVLITDNRKKKSYSDNEQKTKTQSVSLSMVINDDRIFESELSVCFWL